MSTSLKESALKPSTNPRTPTYKSHGRTWQLWTDGVGRRSIHYWGRDGEHKEVAVMKTSKHIERSRNGYKTTVTWKLYQWRWTCPLGEHKSPVEAFRKFTSNL